jgi:hypothetical protein
LLGPSNDPDASSAEFGALLGLPLEEKKAPNTIEL